MPKISIIVPVYNVERYLVKCMDSLVNQTCRELEIIAVNDGSTDSSPEILCAYAEKDKRISIINKCNEGVSTARNTALKRISGDYLMFVDGDDWIDPETCETVWKTAEQYACDVVMWSYVREYAKHSAPKNIFPQDIIYDKARVKSELHRRFVGGIGKELSEPENLDALCPIWAKLYKTSLITENNIEFEDIRKFGTYEDGIFNLYLFKYIDKAIFISQHFYHYRKNNDLSVTAQYKPFFKEQWCRLFDLMDEYIDRNGLESIYKQALGNRIAVSILGLGLNVLLKRENAFARIQCIKGIINETKFRKAYRQLDLKYFPLHWKIFFGFAKYNFATGVYLLLLVIQKIIRR